MLFLVAFSGCALWHAWRRPTPRDTKGVAFPTKKPSDVYWTGAVAPDTTTPCKTLSPSDAVRGVAYFKTQPQCPSILEKKDAIVFRCSRDGRAPIDVIYTRSKDMCESLFSGLVSPIHK